MIFVKQSSSSYGVSLLVDEPKSIRKPGLNYPRKEQSRMENEKLCGISCKRSNIIAKQVKEDGNAED
jgi:hypothetical protein